MSKPQFPQGDFKLNTGNDPKVRQWLKDNGCTWTSKYDLITHMPNEQLLIVTTRKLVSRRLSLYYYNLLSYPEINPYHFIIEQPVEVPCAKYVNHLFKEARQFTLDDSSHEDHPLINELFSQVTNRQIIVDLWMASR